MDKIDSFRGLYQFLSNMFESPVTLNGITFRNAEAAFQSLKDPSRASEFADLTGAAAKKLGRRVQLRPDWNDVRVQSMLDVLRAKFQNPDLQKQLLSTGSTPLIEGNTWNDTFWGVDANTGTGENTLGKLLMQVRQELQPTSTSIKGDTLDMAKKSSLERVQEITEGTSEKLKEMFRKSKAGASADAAAAEAAATDAAAEAMAAEGAEGAETAGGLKGLLAKLKGSKLGGWVYKNPAAAAGLGLGGAANIAGLFDNDKVIGQLTGVGLGIGGSLLANKLGAHLSNPMVAGISLGTGALGAFFDMLRANKEKYNQYAANPNMRNGMVQLLPNDDTMYVTPEEWQRMQGA